MRMNSAGRSSWLYAVEGGLLAVLAGMLLDTLGVAGVLGLEHPVAAFAVVFLVGAALGTFARDVWLVAADVLFLGIVALVALTPISDAATRTWVRSDSLQAAPLDAVVVLSSGLMSDTALAGNGADRLLRGLELVHAGVAPRLVTTRFEHGIGGRDVSSDPDQRRIVGLAGGEARWTAVGPVETTHDEAVKSAQLLLPTGARRIAVVTSPSHTRRACATFENVGFKVTCVPALERDHVTWHPVTAEDRLAAFRAYLYERLGTLKYRLEGWM